MFDCKLTETALYVVKFSVMGGCHHLKESKVIAHCRSRPSKLEVE